MATKTYTYTNGQTADGGQIETDLTEIFTNITNDNISASAAIAFSKLASAAWGTWTPTVKKNDKSTALTATVDNASYIQIGRIVMGVITLTTVSDPSGASIHFSAPVTPVSKTNNRVIGAGYVGDNSTNKMGYAFIAGTETTYIAVSVYGGGSWGASGNAVNMSFMYEASA